MTAVLGELLQTLDKPVDLLYTCNMLSKPINNEGSASHFVRFSS